MVSRVNRFKMRTIVALTQCSGCKENGLPDGTATDGTATFKKKDGDCHT
jgi:hypothetical protein